jgi:hypothetical protein
LGDLVETSLGLRHEKLRDRDVVLRKAPQSHFVELDQSPRLGSNEHGKHEHRIHPELPQDERLGRVDVAVQERHSARLPRLERISREREVGNPIGRLVPQPDLAQRVLRGVHEIAAGNA